MNILTKDDHQFFKEWLNLNLTSISWEGRYLDDFNHLWDSIFDGDIEIKELFSKFDKIIICVKQGPLNSWFHWLRSKLVCYLFIYKNLSILDIASEGKLEPSFIAYEIRNFLVERFPHLESELNEFFQIGNTLSKNKFLKFRDLVNEVSLEEDISGSFEEEVELGFEVTLYQEWKKVVLLFDSKEANVDHQTNTINNRLSLGKQVRFFHELIILFVIGGLLILGIKYASKNFENNLIKKITLFSPDFFWLDSSLTFSKKDDLVTANNEILNEITDFENSLNKKDFDNSTETIRYEVESDVTLTSADSLPRDFDSVSMEKSLYEENKKGGYRNSSYGRRKAYRVMMTSVQTKKTKDKIINLLNKYSVVPVGEVKPGTLIPGGVYFNLNVPRKNLKEFLTTVSSMENESTILESRTIYSGPADTDRVFIWLKAL